MTRNQTAQTILIASVFATALLYVVPFGHYIAYPLVLLSTMVHEMGHGFAAVAVGGDFESFRMWPDGSGVAHISGYSGRFAQAFVAAGGLVGPAIGAAACFAMGRKAKHARIALYALAAILLLSNVFFVRNLFGWVFVGLVAMIFFLFAQRENALIPQTALVFVAVQLSLSVFSRSDYLFTSVAHTSSGLMPSDVQNMADALFLPFWFWGALCGLFSVAVLYFGLKFFLRKT